MSCVPYIPAMSDALIDETILNDDNDDDLDYNIDPKEENALLQEEPDLLAQDFNEDDILDLNIDYDQIDVTEDKTEAIPQEKLKRDKILKNNDNTSSYEKRNVTQDLKNQKTQQFKRVSKAQKRTFSKGNHGITSSARPIRRSKTLFINPRFGGPVHVNSRQFAWESPPPTLNNDYQKNQNYIQPWVTGNNQNHPIAQQQVPLNFNPSAFVPQGQQVMYMQPQPFQQTIQPVYQSFVQHPSPLVNQNVLLNQQPTVQMSQCPNQYLFQSHPQMQVIQQVPESSKIPVHQRLGVPVDGFHTPNNNFSQQSNLEMQFDTQNFQSNKFVIDNQNMNQLSQPAFENQKPTINYQKSFVRNQFTKKFNSSFGGSKSRNTRNQCNYKNYNNNTVVTTRDSELIVKNQKGLVETQKPEMKEMKIKNEISSDQIISEEEYQRLIEIQKREREEVLRKKEENRLKSLTQKKNVAVAEPVNQSPKRVNLPLQRHAHQKRFNYNNRNQLHSQQIKSQNYTNIIVITGNDNQNHYDQRFNQTLQRNAQSFNKQAERTVISNQVSSANINLQAQPHSSENLDVQSTDLSPEFLSTRSVSTQDDLTNTNIVVVKNLASCTNEPKILKLCREMGIVQKLRMEKAERQATIHFKTVASAHAFYKKFRRHMIDLSMIQVDLVPCEVSP